MIKIFQCIKKNFNLQPAVISAIKRMILDNIDFDQEASEIFKKIIDHQVNDNITKQTINRSILGDKKDHLEGSIKRYRNFYERIAEAEDQPISKKRRLI
jgi:hypothetical protein